MKLIKALTLLLMAALFMVSCQKEYSEESGGSTNSATGSLQASGSGECLPSSVQGIYIAGAALTAGNFINVTADITALGSYTITTNMVNGYSFSATGIATVTGPQTIKLVGSGKPTAQGANTFTVLFGTSQCNLVVDVLPAGTGAAVISALNCGTAVLSGTYQQGTATTSANTVQITANVTTAGTYNISTNVVNGVTFTGSGVLAAGTNQTITLTANGTPAASGTSSYTVTSGTNTCNFDVTYTTAPPAGAAILTCKLNGVASTFNTNAAATLDNSTGFPILSIDGTTAASPEPYISLGIVRLSAGTIGANTYTANQLASGIVVSCDYTNATGTNYLGGTDPLNQSQTPGFTIKITSITTTRVIGTFSGQIKDNNGSGPGSITVTEGVFDVPVQ